MWEYFFHENVIPKLGKSQAPHTHPHKPSPETNPKDTKLNYQRSKEKPFPNNILRCAIILTNFQTIGSAWNNFVSFSTFQEIILNFYWIWSAFNFSYNIFEWLLPHFDDNFTIAISQTTGSRLDFFGVSKTVLPYLKNIG